MAYKAQEIAETVIDLSRKRNISDLTNLKLQKLVYYSQAWHLALKDRLLFSDAIEAWVHGPVVPCVFRMFKDYRWSVIDRPVNAVPDEGVISHVTSVLDSYGKFGATQLERLTHREDPWIRARIGVARDEPSNNVIQVEDMKRYYSSLLHA